MTSVTSSGEEQQNEGAVINTISNDCLSLIFEATAKMDYHSPYRLQLVYRHWYEVLCHTPLAWTSILIANDINATNVLSATPFIKSGKAPLHIRGLFDFTFQHLLGIQDRLYCFQLDSNFPEMPACARFPLLHRLNVVESDKTIFRLLNHHTFPNLRHLEWNTPSRDVDLDADLYLPHLESCGLHIKADFHWETLIRSCRATITHLDLAFYRPTPRKRAVDLLLPRLRHLSLLFLHQQSEHAPHVYTAFQTPALESYQQTLCEVFIGESLLFHTDVQSVTLAKTSDPLPLQMFRSLEVVVTDVDVVKAMLKSMQSDTSLATKLQRIECRANFGLSMRSILSQLEIVNRTRMQKISFEERDATEDSFRVIDNFGRVGATSLAVDYSDVALVRLLDVLPVGSRFLLRHLYTG